jgi:probable addiction module antidote protein
MPKRTKSYEVDLHERLRDPAYAVEYLRAALEDDEEHADAVFLLALRDVAKANHMTYVAEATGLNRESLYKMLSRRGNPGIHSLKVVLAAVGLKLSVEIADKAAIPAVPPPVPFLGIASGTPPPPAASGHPE